MCCNIHHNMLQCGNFPAARFQGKLCHSWFWKKLLSKQSHSLAHILPRVKKSQPTWNITHSSPLPQPCRCHGDIRVVLERLHPFLDKWTHCCKIDVFLEELRSCYWLPSPKTCQFLFSPLEIFEASGHRSLWNLAPYVMFMLRALYWTHRFNLSELSLRKAILRWCHIVGEQNVVTFLKNESFWHVRFFSFIWCQTRVVSFFCETQNVCDGKPRLSSRFIGRISTANAIL